MTFTGGSLMSNVVRPIVSLIAHPGNTFRRLTLVQPCPSALLVLLLFIISILGHEWTSQADVYRGNWEAFMLESFALILISVTGILILSAVVHLSADLLGGAGRGQTLMFFLMLSLLPLCLSGPAAFLLRSVFSMNGLYTIVLALLAIWSACFAIISIRELYRFTFARAVVALVAPVFLFGAIGWGLIQLLLRTYLH